MNRDVNILVFDTEVYSNTGRTIEQIDATAAVANLPPAANGQRRRT